MAIRAYLRASTKEQNAERAKQSLKDFMAGYGKIVDVWYVENESGAKLDRPELNRLIDDSKKGDILLLEDIDRLTRLKPNDFETLANRIESKGIELVIISLPLTYDILKDSDTTPLDDITKAVMRGMKRMMIDVLATVSRHDYDKRRQRQRQGIDLVQSNPKVRAEKYKGKQPNYQNYINILEFRKIGKSYSEIEKLLNITRATISKAIKWGNEIAENGKKPLPTWNLKTKELVFDKKTK